MADSYLIASTWAHNPPSTNRPSVQDRIRSFSSSSKTPSTSSTPSTPPTKSLSKSSSTSSLRTMTAVSRSPGLPTPSRLSSLNDNDEMNTLSDPRSRAMTPSISESPSPQHPDLSDELATLSNKLINAINHQTNLDDSLNAARHELETARERIRQLEQENDQHDILIARGMLIEKDVVDQEKNNLHKILADERKQRGEVEKEKKGIEQELENLTQALFEEANKMVITAREEARKEQEVILRKNDQLKAQLADTENLLKNHQEQLAELKQVLEQLSMERDDQTDPTEPSTPGLRSGTFDSKDNLGVSELMGAAPEMPEPSYPTSFTHLVHPVLRTDLVSFEDFQALLKISKTSSSAPPSRVSSGSYGGLGLGLGLSAYTGIGSSTPSAIAPTSAHSPSVGSAGSFSGVSTPASTPATPASSKGEPTVSTPLKETKFYKRALAEDIEPCLRLDTAPGLSWLARRSVLNSMCDGSLVVEPMPPSTKRFALTFSCSLCGEDRKTEIFARSHRFRTSETDNAQRYPLCKYCLGRVRSSCDFLGFLRMLKDGHWRAEGEEAEKAAWEESVRLREQMFWCRIGGGVVPANLGHHHPQISDSKSPRASEDLERIEMLKLNEELARTGEIKPRDVTPVPAPAETPVPAAGDDVKTHRRTISANKKGLTVRTDTAAGVWKASQDDTAVPSPAKAKAEEPDTKVSTDEAKTSEPPSIEPTKKEEEPAIKSEETLPLATNDTENQNDTREKSSPSPDVVVTSPSTVEEEPSDAKSEDVKSGDVKLEDAKSEDVKSEDLKWEDAKSEESAHIPGAFE